MVYFLLSLFSLLIAVAARDECSEDMLMRCVDVFNITDTQLKKAISSDNFLERSKEICEPFIEGTKCLKSISQCPNFAEYRWVPDIPDYLREFCEVTNFTHGETYKKHDQCLQRPADESLQCLHQYIMEFPLVPSHKKFDLNKQCCPILKKLLCYRKTFPQVCEGQHIQYDFMEKLIQTLKTNCASVTCYDIPENAEYTVYHSLENLTAQPEVMATLAHNMSTSTVEPVVNLTTMKSMGVGSPAAISYPCDLIVLGQTLFLTVLWCRW